MQKVKAKKQLGQHFLKDAAIAATISGYLSGQCTNVLEIGPGMGILSTHLLSRLDLNVKLIELDVESVHYLAKAFPAHREQIIEGDFLQLDLRTLFHGPFCIIGNFPYNISSQILFAVLDNRELIPEVVGMFQKEVAERIAGPPGSREYGILSVFMQAYYTVEIKLQLDEHDFDPPPKVKSTVLRFGRKENFELGCNETLFRRVVKTAFNQRRKTMRNALSGMVSKDINDLSYQSLRAEALGWEQFVVLTNEIEKKLAG